MHGTNWYNDTMPNVVRRRLSIVVQRKTIRHIGIMPMNPQEDGDQNRGKDQHKPGTIAKLCDRKDQHDNGCANRTESIAEHFDKPTLVIMQFVTRTMFSLAPGVLMF